MGLTALRVRRQVFRSQGLAFADLVIKQKKQIEIKVAFWKRILTRINLLTTYVCIHLQYSLSNQMQDEHELRNGD